MIVVFPFHTGDWVAMRRLLSWIGTLGPCKSHDALLVANADAAWWIVQGFMELLDRTFNSTRVVANEIPVSGWPQGPNSLFKTAAQFIRKQDQTPWLWLESDAVPIRAGWADELQLAYIKHGKRYMGAIVPRLGNDARLPEHHLAGIAVYPWNAIDDIGPFCDGPDAWDIASATTIVPLASNTHLIQHFWGKKNLAPVFSARRGPESSQNTLPISFLRPEAVLFHRCKDDSLIELLSAAMPGCRQNQEFTTVIQFYNGDYAQMLRNLEWMIEISPGTRFECVVATDTGTLHSYRETIAILARRVFRHVEIFVYPAPKKTGWPHGANHAFQHVARHMQAARKAWLWLEADAIPVRGDWLSALQERYVSCGKPLMGSVVERLGHMNGVGVYPSNFPTLSPETMTCTSVAFDWVMKEKTINLTANANDIICHVWAINNGSTVPFGEGTCPSFKTPKDLETFLCPEARLFHRCKDMSLINVLKSTPRL